MLQTINEFFNSYSVLEKLLLVLATVNVVLCLVVAFSRTKIVLRNVVNIIMIVIGIAVIVIGIIILCTTGFTWTEDIMPLGCLAPAVSGIALIIVGLLQFIYS